MNLYIAEKKTLAEAIAGAKGKYTVTGNHIACDDGDIITWTYGHLFSLADPHEYRPEWKKWEAESLPMIPQEFRYKADTKKLHLVKTIQQFIKQTPKKIIHAGDADREGQLLIDEVLDNFKIARGSVRRIKIVDMNKDKIQAALVAESSNADWQNISLAGSSRSKADWLIGLNLTRLYTIGKDGVRSVGRVQTPALRLIVDRQRMIDNFKTVGFYELKLKIREIELKLSIQDEHLDEKNRCLKKELVDGYLELLADCETITITSETKKNHTPPPLGYSLAGVQKEAAAKLKISVKEVDSILQDLYEKHKMVTYPRTDVEYISESYFENGQEIISNISVFNTEEINPLLNFSEKRKVFDSSKASPHDALMPTGNESNIKKLTQNELFVYELIALRFVSFFLPDKETTAISYSGECKNFIFKASQKITQSRGWEILYSDKSITKEPLDDGDYKISPSDFSVVTKKTTPPKPFKEGEFPTVLKNIYRYVEENKATLKETDGIGTSATRTAIIETLKSRDYIINEKGRLYPTDKGNRLIEELPTEITSPALTAEWERKFKEIEKGNLCEDAFLTEIKNVLTKQCTTQKKVLKEEKNSFPDCPNCSGKIVKRNGKNGIFYSCDNFPDCKTTFPEKNGEPDLSIKNVTISVHNCPDCKKPLVLRNGKNGSFFGCSGYPKCKNTFSEKDGKPIIKGRK